MIVLKYCVLALLIARVPSCTVGSYRESVIKNSRTFTRLPLFSSFSLGKILLPLVLVFKTGFFLAALFYSLHYPVQMKDLFMEV